MADEEQTPTSSLYELKARARKIQEAVLVLGGSPSPQIEDVPIDDSVRQDALDCLDYIKARQAP